MTAMMPPAPPMPDWSTAMADHAPRPMDARQYKGTEPKSPLQETKKKYQKEPYK